MKRTNSYGESTGGETTLREVIVKEAQAWMGQKSNDSYRNDGLTNLQRMIRAEVASVFEAEIKDAVKAAREAVSKQIGATVATAVADAVNQGLRAR